MSIPFDPKELDIIAMKPGFFGMEIPVYNYPVSLKEAALAAYQRKPIWQLTGMENGFFTPKVYPDNVARAFVFDANGMKPEEGGGKDMFGIEWEYVPQAGGSMVRPGKPFLNDANEWYDKVVWPDIDSWDWEGEAKKNEGYLKPEVFNMISMLNGWFERLISFMDFEGAIMAIFDDDQKDAVKDFYDKLTDLYIKICDKMMTYFPGIAGFNIHDDWGSQKETFFSPAVAEEMLVPYMRRLTDFLHSKGKFCDFHCCGQNLKQVPNMIKCGWDSWSGQQMNDTAKAYELYGDQILIGVYPELAPDASEEEQRRAAKAYAEKYCNPDKPSLLNGAFFLPQVFREELYKQSRICYGK
ncbi:MAG: methyltransferase [Clostridiales bacterium]|nr:methyltransferase [Clostridiales bacterium]